MKLCTITTLANHKVNENLTQRVTSVQLTPDSKVQSLADSTYVHLFWRDVRERLLPYRLSDPRVQIIEFGIELEDVLAAISLLFSRTDAFRQRLTHSSPSTASRNIEEFLRVTAGDLAFRGESNWEIVKESDRIEDGIAGHVLVKIPGRRKGRKR